VLIAPRGSESCPATIAQVQVVEGSVKGINMRFIDTPGLLLSPGKVAHNANILAQVPSAAPVLSQPHASTGFRV